VVFKKGRYSNLEIKESSYNFKHISCTVASTEHIEHIEIVLELQKNSKTLLCFYDTDLTKSNSWKGLQCIIRVKKKPIRNKN
jgi:hypothetical protein